MVVEREIKLSARDAAVLDGVAQDAVLVGAGRWCCRQVVDHYLDTPTLGLLQRRLALRVRRQDGGWQLGLKGHGAVVDGVSIRQEWEEPTHGLSRCVGDLPHGEIRRDLLAWLDPATPWQWLMTVTMERRTLVLSLEAGCLVEMALDVGQVRAGEGQQHFWEVELEARSGPFSPISRLAAVLMANHDLQPARQSKFHLGLALRHLRAAEQGLEE